MQCEHVLLNTMWSSGLEYEFIPCPSPAMQLSHNTDRFNGLFALSDSDSDSDSDLNCKPNGYIVLCKSSHTAQSQIQIQILTAKYRNGIKACYGPFDGQNGFCTHSAHQMDCHHRHNVKL